MGEVFRAGFFLRTGSLGQVVGVALRVGAAVRP